MRSLSLLLLIFFAPVFWSSGIKNVCKFSIDEKPVVRIDDHMQGIWKMTEDTNAHDYFIVEKDSYHSYCIIYI